MKPSSNKFTTTGSYISWALITICIKTGRYEQCHISWYAFFNNFHKQKVNKYEIYQLDHYWPEESISSGPIREKSKAKTWMDRNIAGMSSVFNNFYMGFSLRLNRLLNDTVLKTLIISTFRFQQENGRKYLSWFNYTIITLFNKDLTLLEDFCYILEHGFFVHL